MHDEQLCRRREHDRERRHGPPAKHSGTSSDNPDENDRQQNECDRASREDEDNQDRRDPPPTALQCEEGEESERDAEGEWKLAREYRARPDQREGAAGPASGSTPLPL